MQFSVTQKAASSFSYFYYDANTALEHELGKKLGRTIPSMLGFDYVSDWLHLWLLSGLGHRDCLGSSLIYMSTVALTYVRYGTHPRHFEDTGAAPPAPMSLIKQAAIREDRNVSSAEYPLPMSLSSEGFEVTRHLGVKSRRVAVLEFIEQPQQFRYGIDTSSKESPYHVPKE